MFGKENATNGEGWVDAIGMYVCMQCQSWKRWKCIIELFLWKRKKERKTMRAKDA